MSLLRSLPPWNAFEVHSFRSADQILLTKHAASAIADCLCEFSFTPAEILRGGGGLSAMAQRFERSLDERGFQKQIFSFDTTYEEKPTTVTTHEIDGFGDRIAIEFEWNNKNTFFDRDLSVFQVLFNRDLIDLGIIVTRATELSIIFKQMIKDSGLSESKFSTTTTHCDTLLNKLLLLELAGTVGNCPVVAFGITGLQLRAAPVIDTRPDLFTWM